MSKFKKYTDWFSWWVGLRQNLMKCIGTTGVAWLGTNAAAGAGAHIKGIDWEQAVTMFGVHIAFEVFTYLQKNQPQVITETVDEASVSKNPETGTVTATSSTKVTTTPIVPPTP